jgi:hypothetical protein
VRAAHALVLRGRQPGAHGPVGAPRLIEIAGKKAPVQETRA